MVKNPEDMMYPLRGETCVKEKCQWCARGTEVNDLVGVLMMVGVDKQFKQSGESY